MAEENKEQESGQEQELAQGEGPAQEPAENPQKKEPVRKKGDGLLMPMLYALLAGVGAFTLVMIIGIVLTFFFQPADPSETPSAEPSSLVTLAPSSTPTETQEPDGEGPDTGDEP